MKVLQLNLFLRPPGISNPSEGDFKDERLSMFLSILSSGAYDVLLLQEVFKGIKPLCCIAGRRLNALVDAAADSGYEHSHVGPSASGLTKFLDGGLLILSRYPIIKRHTLVFKTLAASGDSLSSKGCLHALLSLPGGELFDVFTAHTQASYTYTPSQSIDRVQRGQVRELADFMKECMEGREQSCLFGGDLNIDALQDSDTGSYTYMMETMREAGGFDGVVDLVLERGGGHPITSVPYLWDESSGSEIVKGSYLGRGDVKAMEVLAGGGRAE